MTNELLILPATDAHMPAMQALYAWYVLNATCSFEEVPPTVAEMQGRLDALRREGLPWLVALWGGQVVGYAYAGRYRARPAYNGTVENSIYVAREQRGQGVGRALLEALLARCHEGRFQQMVAVVGDSANTGSIALHERAGFRRVGVLQDVGFKFGRHLDTVLMQRSLAP